MSIYTNLKPFKYKFITKTDDLKHLKIKRKCHNDKITKPKKLYRSNKIKQKIIQNIIKYIEKHDLSYKSNLSSCLGQHLYTINSSKINRYPSHMKQPKHAVKETQTTIPKNLLKMTTDDTNPISIQELP